MKVLVVYYSMYGHVMQLARAVEAGARAVAGADVILRRVKEFPEVEQATASNEFAVKIREQQTDVPIVTLDDLRAADAVIFGTPTRYGNMTAQMKQLFDSTASLWLNGEMEGKIGAAFTSTASTHGGQETTLVTMMIPMLHLGMIIVGVPYSAPGMIHTEARGGTPYGPSTVAGARGELQPSKEDWRSLACSACAWRKRQRNSEAKTIRVNETRHDQGPLLDRRRIAKTSRSCFDTLG